MGKRFLIIQSHSAECSFCQALAQAYGKGVQALEFHLQSARDDILRAEHWVIAYLVWWGAMPALLKSFFDRVFAGRSAHDISIMDTPPWYYRLLYCMPGHDQIKRAILELFGVRLATIASDGAVKTPTPQQRQNWLSHANCAGSRA